MKLHPRLSLLNLLLLTAVIALWYGALKIYFDQEPLRAEIRELKRRLVGIEVTDESRFHAAAIPEPWRRSEWRWRVWAPEGGWARLSLVGEPAEIFDVGQTQHPVWIPRGASTIRFTAALRPGYNPHRQWWYAASIEGRGAAVDLEGPATYLVRGARESGIHARVGEGVGETVKWKPGAPMTLIALSAREHSSRGDSEARPRVSLIIESEPTAED